MNVSVQKCVVNVWSIRVNVCLSGSCQFLCGSSAARSWCLSSGTFVITAAAGEDNDVIVAQYYLTRPDPQRVRHIVFAGGSLV